ncbi:hypothetical protein [Entomomonas moraniae]|uniref:hypothetical protein n=1 Tax=Entomomonas moraniae TaxID=2213226 RepID=UPI001E3F93FE|nr:hypothetical protein [Entomomonas moraniae]
MIDDEDLEQEELDDAEDQEDVTAYNGPDRDEPEDVNELDELPKEGKKISKPSLDEEELPNIEAKQKDRDALELAMKEFLAKGGKIETLESSND